MAVTTTTEIAGPVNRIFQTTLLRNAKSRAPHFVGSVAAEISEHRGTFTALWRRIENLTATTTALNEVSGSVTFPVRTAVQPSVTNYTATLSKYGNFIFLSEEVDLINFSGQMDKLVEILGINAGQSLNRLQRDRIEDNSTAVFTGTGSTATDTRAAVNANSIRSAVNALQRQSALKFTPMVTGSTRVGSTPIRDSYWGICHSDVEEDIRQITGFNSVETYGGHTEIAPGEFGNVGGIRWVSTEEAGIDTGSAGTATSTGVTGTDFRATSNTNDLYASVVMGMDFHGSVGLGFNHIKEIYMAGDRLPGVQLISKAKGSAGAADPLNDVGSVGWKSWHASVILNANWGRRIMSVATLY